jgi:putative FmdB family regulatory protein
MPTYQYVCRECDHKFEQFCSLKDYKKPTKHPCPKCSVRGKVEQTAWGDYGVGIDKNMDPLGYSNLDKGFQDRMKHIASKAPRFDGIRQRMKERFG